VNSVHNPPDWELTKPTPSEGSRVKVKNREVLFSLIGSKERQGASSRLFVLDAGDGVAVVSPHRAIKRERAGLPRQENSLRVQSSKDRRILSALSLWTPPAGKTMNKQSQIGTAKKTRTSAFNLHSESVPNGVNERVSLLSVQQEWSPIKAMRWCVRGVLNGHTDVSVKAKGKNLSVSGVSLCRNPLCPYCSYKRSMESAEVLSSGLKVAKRKGYFTRLLTLTIPSGGSYSDQRGLLASSLRRFSREASRLFKKMGADDFGLSWSFDVTMKVEKRWSSHLHIHAVLVASNGTMTECP
jgi:hypothetical protein